MSRPLNFFIFISAGLSILLALHYYFWRRLVRDTQLARPWRAIATIGLVLAGLSIPTTLFFLRGSSSGALRPLLWASLIWMGSVLLMFVALLSTDAIRLGIWGFRRAKGEGALDAHRRRFIARFAAGGAAAATVGLGSWAVGSAVGPISVRRVEVPLRRLGREHDGVTFAQLTDLHIGPTIGKRHLESIVQSTNALAPDIVAITGDLVDGSVERLRDAVSPLAELRARFGVYFVTGNHEYYSGARQWVEELTRLGIRVLRNERVEIAYNGRTFDLAGVDDHSAARYPEEGHGENLARALQDRQPDRLVVLLAHQPRTVLEAARFGVDLQLSGHTHGGQIWPLGALVRLQQRFIAGLHRHTNTHIYVSRGTGYWGPPMRLGAPAEIAQIVLRSDPAGA
jgi:predicted MPP superfamily phosphohydrolase